MYVGHVILHRQSPILSNAWNKRSVHVTLLEPTFCKMFPLIENDKMEYVQCGYTQWCIIREVSVGIVLISIWLKHFRAQSLHTSIHPAAVIPTALSKTSFYFLISWISALLNFVLELVYRMFPKTWVVYHIAFYMIRMETAKFYETGIMCHMHITVITTKFRPLLNLQYVIWAKRFDNMIDFERIVYRIKFSLRRVYDGLVHSSTTFFRMCQGHSVRISL